MKKRIKKKLFKKKLIGSVDGETNIKIKNVDKKVLLQSFKSTIK